MPKPSKNKIATEEFVWKTFDTLRGEMDEKFNELESRFQEMSGKLDKMLEHIVDLSGKFKKFDDAQEIFSHRTYENTNRIEKLEKAVFKTS